MTELVLTIVVIVLFIAYIYEQFNHSKLATTSRPKPTFSKAATDAADLALYRYNKHQYLNSPEWKSKRIKVLTRADFCCEMCHAQTSLQVHHISYKRLYREPLTDLVALCSTCHQQVHEHYGYPKSIKDYDNFHGPIKPIY